jgi:hypothetical protein
MMKKRNFFLPPVFLVTLLAACNSSLSQDKAVEQARKIKAFHEASSFAYPKDKVTYSASMTVATYSMDVEYRIQKDSYLYIATKIKYPATSSLSAGESSHITYYFSKDGRYYEAVTAGSQNLYQVLTQENFTTTLSSAQDSAFATAINGANDAYSYLDDFVEVNTPSSSSGASSSPWSIDGILKTTYAYSSSGDGNLTIRAETMESTSTAHATGVTTLAFNQYYPVSMTFSAKGEGYESSEWNSQEVAMSTAFKWGTCDQITPDLSQHSQGTL